jgi:hypothetical protein
MSQHRHDGGRRRRARAGGLLLAAACPLPAAGQTPDEARAAVARLAPGESFTAGGVTIRMNRKQAGAPDKDGWYPASSAGGRFGVRMPGPYNDLTTVAQAVDGTGLESNSIGGTSAEGARFLAHCTHRSDGSIPADWAGKVAVSLVGGAKQATKAPVASAGVSGFEIHLSDPARGTLAARLVAGRQRMCNLSVEYQGPTDPALERAARTFLESFALEDAAAR